jgi:hypothetical protein
MFMQSPRRWAMALAVAVTAASLTACSDSDDCTTVATGSITAAFVAVAAPAPPPPPKPVRPPAVINPPKVNTPPPPLRTTRTQPTATRTTAKATAAPTTATTRATTPTATVPTNPVTLTAGKKQRQLPGEKAYYPTPLAKQEPVNVVIAQEAVRKHIAVHGRFTEDTRFYNPVTKRTYIYHDDDTYRQKGVPQDPYDPFDTRNWTHQYSPFNLTLLIINGQPVANGPNLLNGDYADDEGPADNGQESSPSPDPSPSNAGNSC